MNHMENLTQMWAPLLTSPEEIKAVAYVTCNEGGTRSSWGINKNDRETMLMAWPEKSLMRSGVLVSGGKEKQLQTYSVFPLMEGIPNMLTIEGSYAWKNGVEGEVEVLAPGEETSKLWFYDPLFFRDREVDITEGVTQTFILSALCLGLRRALLDEMTITEGPNYEAWAKHWLSQNEGKTRLDIPPLKVNLKGMAMMGPGSHCTEYQGRAPISNVGSFEFGPEGAMVKVYRFVISFGKPDSPLHILVYAPEKICANGYEPKDGDEIDLTFWLQGRVADIDMTAENGEENLDSVQ